ncbi:MAG TPA: LysE family translocator [Pseudomonas sp.]|uniref:LysE family translocator n=1 Tax=Pseudomonas sp. TaxID=306 RepID=UPI002B493829|nr:LysE family translocator [Pseudomonas sp.]HKS11881.1 LysE family translocator [Pseudomonas sp.]
MSQSTLVAFWAFSLLFVFTPGADWAYAISAGIRNRGVGASVLGLLAGYVLLTILIAAGVGMLIAGNPVLMAVLTVMGALYLAWLGYGMLRNPPVPHSGGGAERAGSWITWFREGALVSGLNPKAFIFFLAFLPPWTSETAAWSIPAQILALGLVYTASCSVVYSMVGFGANKALRTRPGVARLVGRVSGVIMMGLAVMLVVRALF